MTATVYQYRIRTGSRVVEGLSFTPGEDRHVFGVVSGPDSVSVYTRPGTTVRKLRVPKCDLSPYDCHLFDAHEAVEVARDGRFRLEWTPYLVGA